jgi:ATP-dependent RNA helicase DeaD
MDDLQEENGFRDLGLREEILVSLKKAGFKTPSPIQQDVIPLILSGVDVIGQAQTGTGKTAAFGLPALHMLKNTGQVEVLVITPTRELTSQVSEEIAKLGFNLRAKVATVYGGKSFNTQIDAIRRGAHVVVATPGRLLDLLQSGKATGLKPWLVIVDEADEMLDMGFLEDIQAIFELLPEERQTLLFSATMPSPIQSLAKKILKNPTLVKAASTQTSNADISQSYCIVADSERDEAVIRLFEAQDMDKAILFCKTKKEVDRLSQVLNSRGHAASSLHGDMEQNQRESVIHAFRAGKSRILVATDVAARGLNIVDVTNVINFHIPYDADNYVHRIGRTGRAGRKGASLTLVTTRELGKLLHFQQKAGGNFERLYIPSKQEIRKSQVRRLVEQLGKQTPAQETTAILDSLGSDTDIKEFAGKLLGLILSQNPIDGPETIGVPEHAEIKKEKKYAGSSRSFGRRSDRGEWRERSGVSSSRGEGRRERPARSFDRAERPSFSSDRPARSFDRAERPSFRSERPARSGDRPFGDFAKKKFVHPYAAGAKTAEFKKAKKKY